MEMKENTGTKTKKLTWEGDEVRVSTSYQWETERIVSNLFSLLFPINDSIPYDDNTRTTTEKTNWAIRRGSNNLKGILYGLFMKFRKLVYWI